MRRIRIPPFPVIAATVVYVVAMSLLKWKFRYHPHILLFILGSVIGVLLIDIAESLFSTKQGSVFRTLFGEALFLFLSFFVITSSGSIVGAGLVLAYLLRIIVEQSTEFVKTKQLVGWSTGGTLISPLAYGVIGIGMLIGVVETVLFYLY